MENTSTPTPSSTPQKSSSTWLYWLLACCGIVIVIAIIIVIALAYGAFKFTKDLPKPDFNKLSDDISNNLEDDYQKKFDEEMKKLEDQIKDLEDENSAKDDKKATSGVQDKKALLQVATIEGNLSYPSEVIPDLTVCAEEIGNLSNQYCTTELINDPKYTAGRGYQLDVAPGSYYVYSYFIDDTYKAYYTDFVVCGMDISCPSHAKIAVTVNDGDHIENIDPTDWYNF